MWWVIVPVFLLAFTGLCLLAALLLVRRHPLAQPGSPAEYNLEFESVRFTTADGILLQGWWIPAADSKKTVVMLHGYAGSMDPDLKYAPHIHRAGFNVLMFDFRAHGRSGGKISTLGALECADVKAAVEFTTARGITWIGLLGFSMGGRAALLSAPLLPAVRALISDGGPVCLRTAVRQNLSLRKIPRIISEILTGMMLIGGSILSGVNLFKIDPLCQAVNLRGIPVLLIHGEGDLYTAQNEIEKMIIEAGVLAELWSVPEAKHRNIEETRPQEYLERILSFYQYHSSQSSENREEI